MNNACTVNTDHTHTKTMQECSQRRHWIATLHAGFEHKNALNKRKTINSCFITKLDRFWYKSRLEIKEFYIGQSCCITTPALLPKLLDKNVFCSQWIVLLEMSFEKDLNTNRQCKIQLKGGLRPELNPCFYGIFLLILLKKSLVQSVVAFWSDLTKKVYLTYKVTKFWILHKWHRTHKFTKHFTPGFLYIFLLGQVKLIICLA